MLVQHTSINDLSSNIAKITVTIEIVYLALCQAVVETFSTSLLNAIIDRTGLQA